MLLSTEVRAAAVNWQAGSGAWNNGVNWSTGTVPTSNDDVTINSAVTVQVNNQGGNAVARTLTLGSGAALTRANGRTLAVGQGINVASGNATLNIPFTAGTLSNTGTGTLTVGQSGTVTGNVGVSDGGTLAFTGTATLGAGSFTLASGSALTLNFSNTTTVALLTVSGNATVAGTLNLTGSTPSLAGSPYHLVRSTGGTIDFTGLSLGTVPGGRTFGFRVLGTDLVMDVTQNPIAIDSVTSTTGTCAAGTVSWQHTIGATANDRLLIVGVSTGSNSGSALPTSVRYGTQTLTARGGDNAGTTQVQIYTLLAPPRGTNTVTLTFPGGSTCFAVAGSVSYTGVSQSNPIGGVVSDTETGNTPLLATIDVNVQPHYKVFAVLSSNTATSATPVQSNVTARWSALNGTEFGTAETLAYGGNNNTTITLSYNMGPPSSTFWSLSAMPIHPANPNAAAPPAPVVRWSAGGAALSWSLDATSDVVGFRVWREAAGQRVLLTPGLLAGPLLASRATLLAGSQPGWVDRSPVPSATYLVESLHRDGSTRWTPAVAGSGTAPALSSELVAVSPSSLLRALPGLRVEPADLPALPPRPGSRELQWELAAGHAVKLVVSRPGVVRVSAESLFAAEIPVGTPASSLQLFREGRPVGRTVLTTDGATLQPGDSVEFYGHGMDTRYSGSAVYWLTTGAGRGREIPTVSAPSQGVDTGSFMAATEIRERLTWFGAARNGDAEKFFGPAVHSQARTRTISAEGLDVAGSGAQLEVALQGVTEVPHAVNVSLNGLSLGTLSFEGAVPGRATFGVPPGALIPGDNEIELVAPAASDISLEEFVRLVYPRQTLRGSGALDFRLQGGSATLLKGFDPTLTRVLDVTDPEAPVQLVTWDLSSDAAVAAPGSGPRHLLAYIPGDTTPPASVRVNHPSSWHAAEGADLVIVGPAGLFGAVKPLVERRQSEGLRVALVDIEDVQDEFASGEKSAEALRRFLAQALEAWTVPPRFLLLLGAATYDPRDYLGLGGDLVPSAVVQTDALEAVSDSWFLGVSGAESVSIGRLPVHNVAETEVVVAKILNRREGDARSPVLLASDALGTSDFPEMTADLRASLPDAAATVLVRGTDPDDVLHQRFVDAARSGPALVNYAGHASELFWNGHLHSIEDAETLAGGGTSLWIHMTCLTGFFQDPRRQSLAVATLLAPSGGAWGAWGSTSMTYPTEHSALNRALVKGLLLEGKTLGEATREALAGTTDVDLANTFVLLGDPSARAVAAKSSALRVSGKSSSALGCSTAGHGTGSLALLAAVALWLALSRGRAMVLGKR